MGSPIYLPDVNPRPDPWSGFIAAYLQGLEMRRQREAFQSELADRQMRRKYQGAQIKAQELEDKIRAQEEERKQVSLLGTISGRQEPTQIGMPDVSVPAAFRDILGATMPQEGSFAGPMGLPSLTHTANISGMGPTQVPSREGNLLAVIQEQQAKAEAERLGKRVDVPPQMAQALGLGEGPVDPAVLTAAGQAATVLAPQRPRAPVVLSRDIPELGLKKGDSVDPEQLQAQTGLQNAAGTRALASATHASAQSQRMVERENRLLDDFTRDTKDFAALDDAYSKVKAAATSPEPSGASDLALIFGYMKTIDPGSTVREGERATAENAGGIPETLRNSYNRILTGQRLSPQMRQQFLRSATEQYNSVQKRLKATEKRYQVRARSMGVNPDQFVFQGSASGNDAKAPAGGSGAPEMVKWQGQTVPFASLPPAVQQQVLQLMGR